MTEPPVIEIRADTPQGVFLMECLDIWLEMTMSGAVQDAETIRLELEICMGNIRDWNARYR